MSYYGRGRGNLYRVVNAKKLINPWLVAWDLSTLEDPRVRGTSTFYNSQCCEI